MNDEHNESILTKSTLTKSIINESTLSESILTKSTLSESILKPKPMSHRRWLIYNSQRSNTYKQDHFASPVSSVKYHLKSSVIWLVPSS